MKAMKKTVLATAVLMSLGAGVAEAAVSNFTWDGFFLMYDGTDPANLAQFGAAPTYAYLGPLGSGSFSAGGLMDNGTLPDGDPITGTFALDFVTGTGTGTIVGAPFFGDPWTATVTGMTRNYTEAGYTPASPSTTWHTTMTFDWGVNSGINVAVDFDIPADGVGSFSTVGSWMFDGPFVTAQPTFSGTLTAVPVPATAWIVGSGLLGLMGVGATRRKKQLAA